MSADESLRNRAENISTAYFGAEQIVVGLFLRHVASGCGRHEYVADQVRAKRREEANRYHRQPYANDRCRLGLLELYSHCCASIGTINMSLRYATTGGRNVLGHLRGASEKYWLHRNRRSVGTGGDVSRQKIDPPSPSINGKAWVLGGLEPNVCRALRLQDESPDLQTGELAEVGQKVPTSSQRLSLDSCSAGEHTPHNLRAAILPRLTRALCISSELYWPRRRITLFTTGTLI
ncbi:hypothetical protein J7T55_015753 [Diaporthe amygdali]|uniref:uncharacterized protein n=1 Tax=Phomopsis amygdali TaxID=1214568 RepID=UPI0022FF2835|nr:uncharacterized protein J7T55_015753 [Diaporthe amygdali]KAJ0107288.1 hypothetical protein J7T55_015753 [Diaporthe amygdali]